MSLTESVHVLESMWSHDDTDAFTLHLAAQLTVSLLRGLLTCD